MSQVDEPVATPVPRTADELASDELWKNIRADSAGKSSEELHAAAKKAEQELDAKIATDRVSDATITRGLTNMPSDDTEDEIERIIKQSTSADAELKEAINTESNAELHDILRLAGRLK